MLNVTDSTFDTEIAQHKGFVLVDFWAEWCGPCRMMNPAIQELAFEYADKVKVSKLNTEEAPETQASYGVRAIPSLVLFKDGQEVDRTVGARNKAQLKAWLERAMQTAGATAV